MAFVVDSSEWDFGAWSPAEIEISLGVFLERANVALERRERVWVGDDLQTKSVLKGHDLWQLWSPGSPVHLPPELRQELAAVLGVAMRYLDDAAWPEGLTESVIQIDDEVPSDNIDVAWAHHSVRNGNAVGCLSLRRSGLHRTRSKLGECAVHWIRTEAEHRSFFRSAIVVERDSEATLQRLAGHAFPDLFFCTSIWGSLSNFDGGYFSVSPVLREYLAVLDDHGKWIFTCPPPALHPGDSAPVRTGTPSNQLVEKRFRGFGINVAPENPNVFSDSRCRKAREVCVEGTTLYCEWHAKLEPNRNRVHVHPPVSVSSEKVVIAVFAAHLPLP